METGKKRSGPGRADRTARILDRLENAYPDAQCALKFNNPLELLVATILSAQCTDERVNFVTRDLFKKYRSAADYADAKTEILENDVRSTGFFRNKTKNIQGACRKILDKFGGDVPDTMEELLELPGVARKTANVVLGVAFNKAGGVVVDTHVFRVSGRLGLSNANTPEKIERDLMRILPQGRWIAFSHQAILHGRQICKARKPLCPRCPLEDLCYSEDKQLTRD
ncbi:MAG: endonuclease III [Acidobacteria bacterium]|nr:endonuclease III [Acidobacteriota bacterium]